MTTITALPTPPSRSDPTNFAARADDFLAALPTFGTECNTVAGEVNSSASSASTSASTATTQAGTATTQAGIATTKAAEAVASALTAVNAPGTSATSTTSLTVGTGAKSLTIQTAKSIVVGMEVVIAYTTTPTTRMVGTVTAYNSGTGALDVTVSSTSGSGTQSAWTVSLTAAASPSYGKQTIWIPAVAMIARTTNGAAAGSAESTTNKIMLKTLDFDQTTAEYAQFQIRMPKSWNESTVTAKFSWSSAVSGTNAVVWGLQAVAISDDDALDAAFGTGQTVTDAQTAVGDLMNTAETSAITIGGTPAAEDWVVFQVYRLASDGADTLAGDARLHGITLYYTTDAATDA